MATPSPAAPPAAAAAPPAAKPAVPAAAPVPAPAPPAPAKAPTPTAPPPASPATPVSAPTGGLKAFPKPAPAPAGPQTPREKYSILFQVGNLSDGPRRAALKQRSRPELRQLVLHWDRHGCRGHGILLRLLCSHPDPVRHLPRVSESEECREGHLLIHSAVGPFFGASRGRC
ncbi:hypothetical protein DFJ74DRAFT_40480 [Hyaloraphidium curvatum]|nr:hypothetical protein DFJ74DRAFT_40480 [Hyaloraphidium curvatum]